MWGTSSYSQVALISLLFVTSAPVLVPVSRLHVHTKVQEEIPAASLCAYGRFALTCLSPLPRHITAVISELAVLAICTLGRKTLVSNLPELPGICEELPGALENKPQTRNARQQTLSS